MRERRVVVVVGVTSAITRAMAAELARAGFDLVLAARDAGRLEAVAADLRIRYDVHVETTPLSVGGAGGEAGSAADGVAAQAERALELAGSALFGCVVGIGRMGDMDAAKGDPGELARLVDVNLTAPAIILALAAERLEARGSGFLAAITSVAGDRGRQSNYPYGAAKAGLNAYLDGLRNRLHHAGVTVTTVKPGFVDTPMTYGLPGLFLVARPEAVARRAVRAILAGKPQVYAPGFWRWILRIIRAIPEPLFKRLRL
jgi:decaprenylphospho-beta-D-erythro-pentofuranosid-2-ulose 2-reductase